MNAKNEKLRKLPKIDKLTADEAFAGFNEKLLTISARKVIEAVRTSIIEDGKDVPDNILDLVKNEYITLSKGSLYKVINATGVPIHTNLGRSPISKEILEEAAKIASGYSNLEFDIYKGKRGDRYHHVAEYLRILTGAEDAVIVNNNASAVFLILNTFAKSKEVIVSRGELVEIGGSFRVPDVMSRSGAKLVEVGTTNKTRKTDYDNAAGTKTAMMMKVHKSNYEIVGFSEEATLEDIVASAKEAGVLSYYDAGSGLFKKIQPDSVCSDSTIPEITEKGFDLVSFSGDKMLGSCQAGIITGSSDLIKKIKKNPLMRMFRVDKLTLAILQATFRKYIEGSELDIPTNHMLAESADSIRERAKELTAMLTCDAEIVKVSSTIGGGSCPLSEIDSYAVVPKTKLKAQQLEKVFRNAETPIIGRINDNMFMLDMRTVNLSEYRAIINVLKGIK